ncbi:MAG: exodeoxyribonuclease VII small subunit [Chloroflexi bacterium]|jgi:exodeoxyribonuclease VII small subunit|nr:exodeoxyribonuclease VII small subunit [Chloroflexota bacterium]
MAEGLSFEEGLNRLEKIVQTLEAGGLSLEEAISLFEEGMQLAKICNQRLDAAELKVSQLQTAFDKEIHNKGESPC